MSVRKLSRQTLVFASHLDQGLRTERPGPEPIAGLIVKLMTRHSIDRLDLF